MTTPTPDLSYLKETAKVILNGDDTAFPELEYSVNLGLQHILEEARNGSQEALERLRLIVVLLDQGVPLSDLLYALGDALQTATSTTPVPQAATASPPPPRAGQVSAPVAQPVAPPRATPDPQGTQVLPDPNTLLQPDPAVQPAQPDPAQTQGTRPRRGGHRAPVR